MSSSSINVFIDTNVWFSAFYGSKNAEKLIKAHIEGEISAIISQQVLHELVRNISAKVPRAVKPMEKLFKSAPPKIYKDPQKIDKTLRSLVDSKDQVIFQAAVNSGTKIFVTGNIKDFDVEKIKKLLGVEILTPNQVAGRLKL